MIINGTTKNETISGTDDPDEIDGLGGRDTILAGGGDDTIRFTASPYDRTGFASVDGGAGTDTVVFSAAGWGYYPLAALTDVERIVYESFAGFYVEGSLTIAVPDAATGTFTIPFPGDVTASDGLDALYIYVSGGLKGATEIAFPDVTFHGWQGYVTSYDIGEADSYGLVVEDNGAYVIRASEVTAAAGVEQDFFTGNGNDTLYGSSGREFFSAKGGVNVIHAGAGDDSIALRDETAFSPDSVYDGGDGVDFFAIYGKVALTGSFTGMDGISLSKGRIPGNPAKYDPSIAAEFTITGAQAALLPATLQLTGYGTLRVTEATQFSAARYAIHDGATIALDVRGTGGNDVLIGSATTDSIRGAGGRDKLAGGAGDDTLSGGAGLDRLIGGRGADHFVFDSAQKGAKRDVVVDFRHGQGDQVWISKAVFTGFADLGTVLADQFVKGAGVTRGLDADDRLAYDTATGLLYYDADGAGGSAAVALALFKGTPGLVAADFVIVA